jgi:hypothetical protein
MRPSSSNHGKAPKRHAPPPAMDVRNLLNPASSSSTPREAQASSSSTPREAQASSSSTPRGDSSSLRRQNTSTPRGDGSSLRRQHTNTPPTHFSSGGSALRPPVPPPVPSPTSHTDARPAPPTSTHKRPNKRPPKNKQCNQCPAAFTSDSALQGHVDAVHEKKTPFECEICHTKFRRKFAFTRHLENEHNPNRIMHTCKYCPFQGRKDNIDKHERVVHEGEKKYSCNLCGKKFGAQYSVNVHKCKGPRS